MRIFLDEEEEKVKTKSEKQQSEDDKKPLFIKSKWETVDESTLEQQG